MSNLERTTTSSNMAWMFTSYFILAFLISMAHMDFCTGNKASTIQYNSISSDCNDELQWSSSGECAKQCFDNNVQNLICVNNGPCSGDKVCRTENAEADIACLINACQVECGSTTKDPLTGCVNECLPLDECNSRSNAAFFINCVRNVRGGGFWAAYRYWIVGIAFCCLVTFFAGACYSIFKHEVSNTNKADPLAAINANLRQPATFNNRDSSSQVSPEIVVQDSERNASVTSDGQATAKTANDPKILAA